MIYNTLHILQGATGKTAPASLTIADGIDVPCGVNLPLAHSYIRALTKANTKMEVTSVCSRMHNINQLLHPWRVQKLVPDEFGNRDVEEKIGSPPVATFNRYMYIIRIKLRLLHQAHNPLSSAQYMRSRFRVESWNTGFPKILQSCVRFFKADPV